jgi:hypothetical protein
MPSTAVITSPFNLSTTYGLFLKAFPFKNPKRDNHMNSYSASVVAKTILPKSSRISIGDEPMNKIFFQEMKNHIRHMWSWPILLKNGSSVFTPMTWCVETKWSWGSFR